MLVPALFQGFVEFTQQSPLVLAEFDRRFHNNVAIQIARIAGAHSFDALSAQAELLTSLGAFGDVNGCLAGQGGNVNFAT